MLKEKENLDKLELCYQKQGKMQGDKREFNSLPVQKDDRKDLLFIFVDRTARNRLRGRMVSGLCRGTAVTTLLETSLERMKAFLCWVGNKESNHSAALDCNGISLL